MPSGPKRLWKLLKLALDDLPLTEVVERESEETAHRLGRLIAGGRKS